jgi:hypothetical protein
MRKANTFWAIAIALLAVGAALELRFHRSRAGDASTSTAESLNVPVASTGFVQSPNGKSTVGEPVEASSPATNTDRKPVTAAQISDAEQVVLDRDFAAAAAKPYVEAYQRQHPWLGSRTLAWDHYQAISISAPNGSSATGYLGVFFPTSDGANTGFACFMMDGNADHLVPLSWGFGSKVADLVANFRRNPAAGNGCSHILP